MNTHQIAASDYTVGPDGIVLVNEAGQAVLDLYAQASAAHSRLQACFVGAWLAAFFIERPWLRGFTLTLSVSQEYDDQGGSYRSISSSVADVVPVEGQETPDSVCGDDGLFDADAAQDVLEHILGDVDADLYAGFVDRDDASDEFRVVLAREALAPVLIGGEVSGAAAFALALSEYAARVSMKVSEFERGEAHGVTP